MSYQSIFLVGPMGAGKTTIGKALANHLHRDFFDTDLLVESQAGVDTAWIFDVEGEAGFRKRESEIIETATLKKGVVLATGGGAVLAKGNRQCLSERGFVVYLKVSLEKQLERMRHDKKRPLIQTDDRVATLTTLFKQRTPLYEEIADFVIDSDKYTIYSLTEAIVGEYHRYE